MQNKDKSNQFPTRLSLQIYETNHMLHLSYILDLVGGQEALSNVFGTERTGF